MFLLTACIFLSIHVVASQHPAVDLSNERYFNLTAIRPGDEDSKGNTLEVSILVDRAEVLRNVTDASLSVSVPGRTGAYSTMAYLGPDGLSQNPWATGFEATGHLDDATDSEVRLDVVWTEEDLGYCRIYIGSIHGWDFTDIKRYVQKTIEVGPRDGYTCVDGREVKKSIEIPEYIQDAFPGATQEQQEEIVEKINSIDNDTYDVSSIYQGRVYIATMDDTNFELDKMNELCKSAGGYLVELDSQEEQFFVRDFLKSLGSFLYFTGANDVDSEGNFVYYNSKKPVTNVLWNKGEPNNGGGNEQCVEILKKGLNDNNCGRKRGYICEIPLFEVPAGVQKLL